jgi:hypothetical protein
VCATAARARARAARGHGGAEPRDRASSTTETPSVFNAQIGHGDDPTAPGVVLYVHLDPPVLVLRAIEHNALIPLDAQLPIAGGRKSVEGCGPFHAHTGHRDRKWRRRGWRTLFCEAAAEGALICELRGVLHTVDGSRVARGGKGGRLGL